MQDICAIRLDFCDFDIPAQTAGVVSSSTARLKVDGPTSNDPPLVNEGMDICKLKQLIEQISQYLFNKQNCTLIGEVLCTNCINKEPLQISIN